MYKTVTEAVALVIGLKREISEIEGIDIVICPSYVALSYVKDTILDSNIKLGAQDVYWEKEGAYTGEVSPVMLKEVGCDYVIIGHSERRQYFGETNETVNKKARAALASKLKPIVCVGETLADRQAGKTFDVVKDHIENSLKGLSKEDMQNTVIAYEPVWAIGTGVVATKEQAQEVHKYIRDLLANMFGNDVAGQVQIQYGGSVKPENAKELMSQPDIDGALVGGASLKADTFTQIIKNSL